MNSFSSSELFGTAVFTLILGAIAFIVIRGMPKMNGAIAALRKRTLIWTQVALVLTVLQLNFKAGDWRFSIILGLIVLFTGSIWLAARHYDLRLSAAERAGDSAQGGPKE
ncbi:hypothetical protein [Paenibacillus sp. URB8-2]|uniref:hypothetical protein n=1 Tax=Paenibacillus sp. URB8-2 TaxID=2741301 RepID=UPI0015B7F777|nr:hypothetical protein [Paenibacillus sp. URB8-2]BCG61465.1 hypothetical protein PUR_48900 [Paenibacillus sp. URB8-2]